MSSEDISGSAPLTQRGIVPCPSTNVTAADYVRVVSGGKVLAVALQVAASTQLVVDASSSLSTDRRSLTE